MHHHQSTKISSLSKLHSIPKFAEEFPLFIKNQPYVIKNSTFNINLIYNNLQINDTLVRNKTKLRNEITKNSASEKAKKKNIV